MLTSSRHYLIKAPWRSDPGATPIDRRGVLGLAGLAVIVLLLVAC